MAWQGNDGRKGLYESMVRRHAGDLYRFAFRLLGNKDLAEDLVQETFFEAWRSLASLRNPDHGRAWLFQILRHRFFHSLRDAQRRPQAEPLTDEEINALPSAEDDPVETLSRGVALQRALDCLPDHYKVPFLMVFLEGLTCQDAADALEIPLGTLLSRIHRARKALQERLRSLESPGSLPIGAKPQRPRILPGAGP